MKQLIKITIVFSVLIAIQLKAQTPISLESAYEKAFKNNLNLKNNFGLIIRIRSKNHTQSLNP